MQTLVLTLLAPLPAVLIILRLYRRSLYHQLHAQQNALVLPRATSDLRTSDIVLVILLLIVQNAKALLGSDARKGAPRRRSSSREGQISSSSDVLEFPDVSVTMNIDISPEVINQYLSALGVSRSDSVLNTNSPTDLIAENNGHLAMFLAAISGPALLLLLARPKCPINPLGAVNVRNKFRIIRPEICRQLFQPGWRDGKSIFVRAVPQPNARHVHRGIEVDIRAVVLVVRKTGQEEEIEVFEQISTVLEFRKSKPQASQSSGSTRKTSAQPAASSLPSLVNVSKKDLKNVPRLASYFKIQLNDPIEWARLCKDYNPIHTSAIAARLFGFRSKIAHGSHIVAKAVQMLTQTGDEGFVRFCKQRGSQELWMQVEFKRPVLLPAEVGVRSMEESSTSTKSREQYATFEVFKDDKVYIEAAVGSYRV